LEGLEISEVRFSVLKDNLRVDSEFYNSKINFGSELYTTKFVDETIIFNKGIFDIKAEIYNFDGKGVPFVRISNLKNMKIDINNIAFIPVEENLKNKQTFLNKNDIILSKTAYPAASLVDLESCNTSQDTIAVKLKEKSKLNSHYLVVYLNTKYGMESMKNGFTGNIQSHLNLSLAKQINIPVFGNLQLKIKELFEKSIQLQEKAKILYSQAQDILLISLNISNLKVNIIPISIKSMKDSFEVTGRLDAEYYQKKYEEYEKLIYGYTNGYLPMYKACNLKDENFNPDEKEEFKYIELADIGNTGDITGCTKAKGADLPTRARRMVVTNDVIVSSIEGSLTSCAFVSSEYNNALCSTGFYIINSDKINSETLLILFKSEPMQNILKKNCSGTILTAINKSEFQNIPVPIIDPKIQTEIKQQISESFKLKKESENLLEVAKRAVEIAIEEGEEKAMEWIEKKNSVVNTRKKSYIKIEL
jgi:restriction endonuclease S subunit